MVPGPGAYNSDPAHAQPSSAAIIGTGPNRELDPLSKARREVPGVGAYNLSTEEGTLTGGGVTIGNAPQREPVQPHSCQASYDVRDMLPQGGVIRPNPVTMARSVRRDEALEESYNVPGVGSYDTAGITSRGAENVAAPSFPVAQRQTIMLGPRGPGPGEYQGLHAAPPAPPAAESGTMTRSHR